MSLTINRTFSINKVTAKNLSEFIGKNPALSQSMIVDIAIRDWLKDPKISLVPLDEFGLDIAVLDIIESEGHKWAVVEVLGVFVTFTLNDDGSLYVATQDGGALQDTEREWYNQMCGRDDFEELLNKIEKEVKRTLHELEKKAD